MPSFLLDENISSEIVLQLKRKRPEISVESVHSWHDGHFSAQPDELILSAAASERLTLVTYDQKTITPVVAHWGRTGRDHSGVIFVDILTIAASDFGGTVRSLIATWNASRDEDWTNAVKYLRRES